MGILVRIGFPRGAAYAQNEIQEESAHVIVYKLRCVLVPRVVLCDSAC